MKVHLRIAIASVAISAATLSAVIDSRAQTPAPVRKPIAESSIKLPDYFGVYAVQKNGELLVLKLKGKSAKTDTLSLAEDVEFLIYDKDLNAFGSPLKLLCEHGEQNNEIELLAKPVSNQPQMLRMIPTNILPKGLFRLISISLGGTEDVSWFVVGPMSDYTKTIKEQAEMNGKLMMNKDFKNCVKYVYPKLIEKAGGALKWVEMNETAAKNVEVGAIHLSYGEPSRVIPVGNELQCTMSQITTMKVTTPTGTENVRLKSTCIAISTDSGKNWYFIDMSACNFKAIQSEFPNVSGALVIPDIEMLPTK